MITRCRGSNSGNTKIRRSPGKDRQKSRDFWTASHAQVNSLNHAKLIAFGGQESKLSVDLEGYFGLEMLPWIFSFEMSL